MGMALTVAMVNSLYDHILKEPKVTHCGKATPWALGIVLPRLRGQPTSDKLNDGVFNHYHITNQYCLYKNFDNGVNVPKMKYYIF